MDIIREWYSYGNAYYEVLAEVEIIFRRIEAVFIIAYIGKQLINYIKYQFIQIL